MSLLMNQFKNPNHSNCINSRSCFANFTELLILLTYPL